MKSQEAKLGYQSADDPFKFILSTAKADRVGDVVDQDWDLRDFKKNPVALFNHSHDKIIGTWENVGVVKGQLEAHLKLAKAGTSALVDEIRSLVEQRILKAVSVGAKSKAIKKIQGAMTGFRYSRNLLLEASLCAVPTNADALISKSITPELRAILTKQHQDPRQNPPRQRDKIMKTMAEQILAAQAANADIDVQIDTLKSIAETEDRNMDAGELAQYETLMDTRDTNDSLIKSLERDEARAASNAVPVTPQATPLQKALLNPGDKREKGSLMFGAIGNMLKAHILMTSPMAISADSYRGDKDMMAMTKAVSAPAMTNVTGWAEELVQQGYGDFMELLKAVSVYPKVPGMRHTFDAYGKITIPTRDGTKQLNGDFVAEGAPIPVKQTAFKAAVLTPKKLAVISTFTREIARRSTPAIEGIIRQAILDDTAEVLDKKFLDATAASTVRPAGLQKIAGTSTAASSGNTAANILTDIKAAVAPIVAANMGNQAVWIMNPIHRIGLGSIMLANGAFLFRDELNSGLFAGFPVITSNNVPVGDVFLVDARALTFANDFGPEFTVSNQATLHMEDDVAIVKPIVDSAGTPVVASPVRSLFQTDTFGIKMVQGIDWAEFQPGGVFYLSAVAW